ncbi:hypothetical protein F4009_17755 [Candidatus Poribacteria bacterium]|nr:hypothetical protein [Candidatus Poribacteria bacterium]MYH82516.1 hypothetical protein [Candidatus Poribacteria bacterium]MYK95813.1 hypothetical protein [Candidatus Poribacteria bacterium]
MAYSNFTLEAVRREFQLEIVESAGIFSQVSTIVPQDRFIAELKEKVELAISSGTEKARSELIVTDVLFQLREHFNRRISFFSGIEFSVDAEQGLTGVCDFLVSLSPILSFLEAPVIILVEAKRENLTTGFGQCAAEMIAAQRFNKEKGNDIPHIYGATTSGTEWRFLKLEGVRLHIDRAVYPIAQCDKILGILSSMVEQKV